MLMLVLANICVPVGEGAEPDSLMSATVPADYRGYADVFASSSWGCCGDSTSAFVAGQEQNCGDASAACGVESFEVDTRDRAGLRRDTWYFLSYQVATIGILYALPESVSGWTDEQKSGYSMSIWWDNVTHPQIDSDDFYINYILHPYWGAAYFVRAQERGYSDVQSFWYAALLSSAYEFGAEALFEEPSIQDLIVTPVGGTLVGMYFMSVRDNIRKRELMRGHKTTKDKWLWVLTDPLGSLNRRFDRLFGWETEFHVRPYSYTRRRDPKKPFESIPWEEDRVYGIEFRFQW